MKKVLFIINGMTKSGEQVSISGGDMRLLEIIRNSIEIEASVLTTPNGVVFLQKYNQKVKDIYTLRHNLSGGIFDNLTISIKSFFLFGTGIKKFRDGIVYSSCEHLYDVLPALRLKFTNKCEWYAVYHWVEGYPWKEKRGNTPAVSRYIYWLNRYISGLLIKLFADQILAVSDQTKEKLISIKHIKEQKIKAVYCGVDYKSIRKVSLKYKKEKGTKYDAVFMKRLNYGKGVLDLLKIWKNVVSVNKDARLAIIGDGSDEILSKINIFLRNNDLESNVDLLGVIYGFEEKFRIINSSKVFLLPTHEENWAIVIGEAMAAGTPVIVSRLKEIVPIWNDNVIWCEVGDIKGFAKATLDLIDNPKKSSLQIDKAQKFIPRYDWKNIAEIELDIPTT